MARHVLAVVAGAGALAVQNPLVAEVWRGLMPQRLPIANFLARQAGSIVQYVSRDVLDGMRFAPRQDTPTASSATDQGSYGETGQESAMSFEVVLLLCILHLLYQLVRKMTSQAQPVINVFVDRVRQSINGSVRTQQFSAASTVPLVSQPATPGKFAAEEPTIVCSRCEAFVIVAEIAQCVECMNILHKSCGKHCAPCLLAGKKGLRWCTECLRVHLDSHNSDPAQAVITTKGCDPSQAATPPRSRREKFVEEVWPPSQQDVSQFKAPSIAVEEVELWRSIDFASLSPGLSDQQSGEPEQLIFGFEPEAGSACLGPSASHISINTSVSSEPPELESTLPVVSSQCKPDSSGQNSVPGSPQHELTGQNSACSSSKEELSKQNSACSFPQQGLVRQNSVPNSPAQVPTLREVANELSCIRASLKVPARAPPGLGMSAESEEEARVQVVLSELETQYFALLKTRQPEADLIFELHERVMSLKIMQGSISKPHSSLQGKDPPNQPSRG